MKAVSTGTLAITAVALLSFGYVETRNASASPSAEAQQADTQNAISAPADAQGQDGPHYSAEKLQQMVAPIALYPDELLTQVLMASTYPLEIAMADGWIKDNKTLKGDALKAELDKKDWDDSIKALTATPDVLATMSKNLEWTQKLGDAVLAQQDDVMDAVQILRGKAYAEKTLTSNDQQIVNVVQNQTTVQSSGSATQVPPQTIVIQSAQPQTVYVPYYNPTVVYGAWAYPSYPPPYYPPPPGYAIATGFASGIAFAAGVAVFSDLWDDDFNWGHHDIDVDINNNFNRNTNINNTNINRPGRNGGGTQWKHSPEHRHGVPYNNKKLDQKFTPNKAARANSSQMRNEFRGKLEPTSRPAAMGQVQRKSNNLGGQTQRKAQQNPALNNRAQSGNRQAGNLNQRRDAQGSSAQQMQRPQNNRPNFSQVNRSGSASRDSAFSNLDSGRSTRANASRGQRSVSSMNSHRGGGGARAGGGRGGGRR